MFNKNKTKYHQINSILPNGVLIPKMLNIPFSSCPFINLNF